MNPHEKQFYRENILQQLDASRNPTLANVLLIGLRCGGFPKTDEAELEHEVQYLISKGFVSLDNASISAGVKRYTITATGTEYLEARS